MSKKNFSAISPWLEFYDRYVNNHEEFTFIYNNKYINLITDPKGFLYTFGSQQEGFETSMLYKTPQDLLNGALFDGKRLNEIWDFLK